MLVEPLYIFYEQCILGPAYFFYYLDMEEWKKQTELARRLLGAGQQDHALVALLRAWKKAPSNATKLQSVLNATQLFEHRFGVTPQLPDESARRHEAYSAVTFCRSSEMMRTERGGARHRGGGDANGDEDGGARAQLDAPRLQREGLHRRSRIREAALDCGRPGLHDLRVRRVVHSKVPFVAVPGAALARRRGR